MVHMWLPDDRRASPLSSTDAAAAAHRERVEELDVAGGIEVLPQARPAAHGCAAVAQGRDCSEGAPAAGSDGRRAIATASKLTACDMVRRRPLSIIMLLRMGAGLLLFGSLDVIPLWAAASHPAGGLQMSKERIGTLLAASSLVTFTFTVRPMGIAIRCLGTRGASMLGYAVSACIYMLLVPVVLLAEKALPAWAALAVGAVLVGIGGMATNISSTCGFVLTSEACEDHPALVGAITGVAVTLEAIGKMLGPAIGAPLLGTLMSVRPLRTGFPIGAHLTFLLNFSSLALACLVLAAACLPRILAPPPGSKLSSTH